MTTQEVQDHPAFPLWERRIRKIFQKWDYNLIDEQTVRSEMARLGYSPKDLDYIMKDDDALA